MKLMKIGSGRNKRLVVEFSDGEDIIELIWFKGLKWLKNSIQLNTVYIIFGRLNFFKNKISIVHPELEIYNTEKIKFRKKLQPIYSSTEILSKKGISNKFISGLIKTVLFDMNIWY